MRSKLEIGVTVGVMETRRLFAGGLLLLTLTLLAYAPVLQSGFIWDDDSYVTENETLRSLDGLKRIWLEPRSIPQYYPVVHTTFWVEYQLWGLDPTGFHVVNVLLHLLNAVLVWAILRRLLPRPGEGPDIPLLALGATWLAAAVFALHPVHVESVAWITERKNVLSGAFYLGSMLVLLPIFGLSERRRSSRNGARYLLGTLLFVAALLSKSVTFSLPAALLLLVYWKRDRIAAREIAIATPMLIAGAAAGLYTAYLERVHVGAQHVDWGLSFADRILIAGRAVVFYAGKLLWPYPLIFSYPRWEIDAGQVWQWLFPVGVSALIVLLYKARGRCGRGPLVAVLFFVGTLFPALGFIDVYPMVFSFVADHFQYLASLGIIVLVVLAGSKWLQGHAGWKSWMGYAISTLMLGGLLTLTFLQTLIYWDAETLWRTTIAANPKSWMAMDNLAELLSEQERRAASPAGAAELRAEATRWRERSLELHQDWLAYEGLAQMRLQAGRLEEAETLFRSSLALAPDNASARLNLSTTLGQLGREREQLEELERTLAFEPEMISALRNMAALRLAAADTTLRDPLEARGLARRACELSAWEDPLQIIVLAEAEAQLGRSREALGLVDRALESAGRQGKPQQVVQSLERKGNEYQVAVATQDTALLEPEADFWRQAAPPRFRVRIETSEGSFSLEVVRALAPIGADRFFQLVRAGFYDDSRIFRVRDGYIAQFGVAGDPQVSALWRWRTIPDETDGTALGPNLRGTLAFAMTGPGSRTTQIYINLTDNLHLDAQGFAPIGEVVEGMDVVDLLYSGYDESAGGGMRGGRQGRLFAEGNAYLDAEFPELSRLVRASID